MGTVSKTAREERFSGTIQRHQYSRYCNFKLICNVLFVYAYISPKKRNTEHYVVKQERALLKSRIFREESFLYMNFNSPKHTHDEKKPSGSSLLIFHET